MGILKGDKRPSVSQEEQAAFTDVEVVDMCPNFWLNTRRLCLISKVIPPWGGLMSWAGGHDIRSVQS